MGRNSVWRKLGAIAVTPSLPKKPGDPSVTTLKVPNVPGNMPEMPSSVVALSDTAMLISKESTSRLAETDEPHNISDKEPEKKPAKSVAPKKNKEERKTTPLSPKPIVTKKSETEEPEEPEEAEQKAEQKAEPKNDESQEVMDILNSTNSPEIDDEKQVIEISEDPIE